MTISDELTRIQNAKSALKTSIENKGVTVSDNTLLSGYSALVDQIQTGGGGGKDYIVEGAVYDPTATYSGAFNPKAQIVTANIPSGFTSIGYSAFESCTSLTSVTIPNSVTSIGSQAFYQCTGLTSVTIGNGVTSIGNNAFNYCSGLTSITIPNGVTSIGNYAFYQCKGLTSVTIPNSVTSIGGEAFRFCSVLTSVTVEATTPPTLGSYAFYNSNNCIIYVPTDSVDTYKTATNWSDYADKIQAIS